MIYFPLSKFVDTAETVVAPGASVSYEGQALVRQPGNPSGGVQPSMAANANEIFVGFAVAGVSAAPFQEAYAGYVDTFTVPSTGTVVLSQTPVSGQIFVFDNTTSAPVTLGGSGNPVLSGKTITGLTAGDNVTVTYKYALTVLQAQALSGNVQPGGYAGAQVGQIGLVKRGLIYTNQVDLSVNWKAATAIKLAANGLITDQSGSGATINGYVVSAPTGDVPYIGIEFSAA